MYHAAQQFKLDVSFLCRFLAPIALLSGFFAKLNPIVHTGIDSQTRYYGSISSQAVRTDKTGDKSEHYLSAEDLQSFVGNTKWNVGA